MGVVWKAEDSVLGRTVAVKILPADLALDEERRSMFLEEARMASSVSHGNIVQVHEMGREGDLDFIVMEYIEGQTLARFLHGRPLPPERIAEWGLQIAQGLSRAHHKGLLHRDLKPANILVTPEGEVKIVDFGLATLFAPTGSTFTTMKLLEGEGTEPRIAGTLPYMSPEQVRAEKLDARSDIFSFGVILYEMATGQRPFTGSTAPELAREIQECRPRPVHDLVPKVPVELHRIIEKALSRRAEDRYQGMGDMAVDLKRLARDLESGSSPSYEELARLLRPGTGRRLQWGILAACILGVAAAAVFLAPRFLEVGKKPSVPARSAVAVLPFETLARPGTESSPPALSFGEEVTTRLSRIAGLEVLSPATTQRYAGKELDPGRIGKELHVGSILVGSIQEGENGGWVSVHLIAVERGSDVWGGRFRLSAEGLSAVEDSIVAGVSEALGIKSPSILAMPVSPRWMENQQAYAYYLAGMERYLDGRSPHPAADARYWFDRALGVDPGYAPAVAMEGELAARESSLDGILRPKRMENALELVNRALELDPTLALALLAKGRVLAEEDRWEEAVELGEQALRASPGSGYTYRILSIFYDGAGDYDKAIEIAERGIQVGDPRPRLYRAVSGYYQGTWEFNQAERTLREGLKRFPGEPLLLRSLADFLQGQDRGPEALEIRREGLAGVASRLLWKKELA
jgi:TolB-like protein/predicted Ser/Thr protein kinase